MRTFTATELSDNSDEVFSAASETPVAISRVGGSPLVLLTFEEYRRITDYPGNRRAVRISDLSDAEADEFFAALDESVARY